MRSARLVLVALIAAVAFSAAACTNPMGPKPAGDTTQSSGTR